jgi:hypothetical protein
VAPSLSDEELDVSMEIVVVLLRPSFGNLGRVVGSFLNSALGPAPPRG